MPPLDSAAVRRNNVGATLRHLVARQDPATMTQLTAATGLSRRTTEVILTGLARDGLVVEVPGRAGAVAGRPPRAYDVAPESHLVMAMHISTHGLEARVHDLRGRVLSAEHRELTAYQDPRATLRQMADAAHVAMVASGHDPRLVRVGALATGGSIGADGLIRSLIHAPQWTGIAPGADLSRLLPFPVLAENDINLAAAAEGSQGCVQGEQEFTWLLTGSRSGAGIVVQGRLHRGFLGGAGELAQAHLPALDDLEDHPVGGLSAPLSSDRTRALAIIDAARDGEADAQGLVADYVGLLAQVLRVFAWTVAPPVVVLGGAPGGCGDVLIPLLTRELDRIGAPATDLRASALGTDYALAGAHHLAHTTLLEALVSGRSFTAP